MIICADLGNTTTTLGILDGVDVRAFWRIMTHKRTADEYALIISGLLDQRDLNRKSIGKGGICSVVPFETSQLSDGISSSLGVEVEVLEGGSDCGINILTDNPSEVGADRIANAVGVFYYDGGPAIVVDLGTATTFDLVSRRGEYLGGVIAPGMLAGARGLWEKARMLPAVEIRRPARAIGTTTTQCMQAGIYYGAIGQIEGIVKRMWDDIGEQCMVVITGGRAELISKDLQIQTTLDPHLTLKGIAYAVDTSLRQSRK